MSRTFPARADRVLLLQLLAEAYDHRAWHGPNLRGSIRGVDAALARRRPGPGRHCIGEVVVHCAYWKYAVRRSLLGERRGTFSLPGHNWFPLPTPFTTRRWRECVALLEAQHRALVAAVGSLSERDLRRVSSSPGKSATNLIYGMAFHDTYHAGQIRHLRALFGPRE